MKTTIEINGEKYQADLSKPLDISIPMSANGPRAWYADAPLISPVINHMFTGSVALGGSVNFRNVQMNPHAHGTHTESVGHISRELNSVNQLVTSYFHIAQLITVKPETVSEDNEHNKKGDQVITAKLVESKLKNKVSALVIRTTPNPADKKHRNYSHSNFPYFTPEVMSLFAEQGIEHLLTDLPSVDREEDGGKLLAHRAFWKYPGNTRFHCSITEFIYVPDEIADGIYLLNLQFAPFENDAAPSRPLLFALGA
jgi:kynurenine formamidase